MRQTPLQMCTNVSSLSVNNHLFSNVSKHLPFIHRQWNLKCVSGCCALGLFCSQLIETCVCVCLSECECARVCRYSIWGCCLCFWRMNVDTWGGIWYGCADLRTRRLQYLQREAEKVPTGKTLNWGSQVKTSQDVSYFILCWRMPEDIRLGT